MPENKENETVDMEVKKITTVGELRKYLEPLDDENKLKDIGITL